MPLILLICLIAGVVSVFGDNTLSGASQLALILSSAFCVAIGMGTGYLTFDDFEKAVTEKIGSVSQAIVILLLIGALGGSWMVSGIVPTLIYYGVNILHPMWFLLCACVVSALVSIVTGSSWTTIATIGIALMGIGHTLGFHEGLVAGSIISGAYFGDKVSPLSDTTVMASQTVGTPLFTHIRYMLNTTIPTFCIALFIYTVVGLYIGSHTESDVSAVRSALSSTFNLSPWLLVVPVLTGVMIAKRWHSMAILFIGILMASIAAVIAQRPLLYEIAGNGAEGLTGAFQGLMMMLYGSTQLDTGVQSLNQLVATHGMAGMMSTIWLIVCAMIFGGAMTATRMIDSLMVALMRLARGPVSLVSTTAATGVFMNLTTSDQYLSIILTASMYKETYDKMGYEPRLLSRTTEDSATVTSVLVPWNSCGMTQSSVLGVSTLAYAPFCFFNYLSPFVTIFMAYVNRHRLKS